MTDDDSDIETTPIGELPDGFTVIYASGTARHCEFGGCDESAFVQCSHHSPMPRDIESAKDRADELFVNGEWTIDEDDNAYCPKHGGTDAD